MFYKKTIITDTGRRCSGCQTFKEWDMFGNSKTRINGKNKYCKECVKIINHNYFFMKTTDEGRKCTLCGVFKTWDLFNINRKAKSGHTTYCKECHKAYQKRVYKKHDAEMKERRATHKAPSNAQLNEEWRLFKLKSRELILTSNYSSFC